MTIHQPNS